MTDLLARVEAMRQKSAEREAERMAADRDRAEENRRCMPTVSAWVDDAKAAFGADQVSVKYAKENGVTLGSIGPEGIKASEIMIGPWNKPEKSERKR